MFDGLKKLLGMGSPVDYARLKNDGAQLIDVRTTSEFKNGHIKGAQNIPLDQLKSKLGKLKKDKAVITCCASGMRSASAKTILKSNGFNEVYNGGGWMSLQRKLS